MPEPGPAVAAYMKQDWSKVRKLVWAQPGRPGRGEPEDWLENGRPATDPPDENTDLYFPAAQVEGDRPPRTVKLDENITCRHLTVAPGAAIFIHTLKCHGNIWIAGRCMLISCNMIGSNDAFLRNDGPQARFTVYYTQSKPEGSVELIGRFETQDEVRIYDGDFLLAPDSRFEPGRNSTPIVDTRARMILHDGAYFGKWLNDFYSLDMVLRGTLQGGTTERPLTRDCRLALSFQNWSQTDFRMEDEFAGDDRKIRFYRPILARKAGMVVLQGGAIRTVAKPNSGAKLTIDWHGLNVGDWRGGNCGYVDVTETIASLSEKCGRTIPPRITIYFDEETTVDGLRLDHVHEGGILVKDPSAKATWRNISYGKNNDAPPEKLYRHLPDGLSDRNPKY